MTAQNRGIDLLILESHPVQYHAPVYRELSRLSPGRIHVAYATDRSVRGHYDPGFGQSMAWDVPLLEGYEHTILGAERHESMNGTRSLHGRDIPRLLKTMRPRAVLFTQLAYEFEWVAYATCLYRGIPIWFRMETQDEAVSRGWLKSLLRGMVYRLAYAACRHFFFIGELNRRHYLAHGAQAARMSPARYCVPDALATVSTEDKLRVRETLRERLGFGRSDCVVGFFGKLIPKKDPGLVMAAWSLLPAALKARLKPMFVGDGELRSALERQARDAAVPAVFAGFINQRQLPDYYLAADIVVLPSRRMGETWGLVVNEALLAGCGVVMTEAVGCGPEFSALDRVRIVPIGSAAAAAGALSELAALPRDFDWARAAMADYSIEAAARGLAAALPAL